ncbi:trimethylamine methyltransferase family protein [Deltaproteobacteria bacterium OttesenSCG-928-M10]|nr:trimethylamine methyltransferase family protein [Deltaproteobacteria bacterium OttesenSCG-928-M10]
MGREIKRRLNFSVLTADDLAVIQQKSLDLLKQHGMRMAGERSLAALREYGCAVDASGLVTMPAEVVERALADAPKSITLYDRAGEPWMTLAENNSVYFGTHADQLNILDFHTGRNRPFSIRDTPFMCRLANHLDNISFIYSVGMCGDVRPEIQSQTTFLETISHCRKVTAFSTNDIKGLQECIDMAAIVRGGPRALAEKPFIFNYCEPIPPRTHPLESTEKLRICALNGIPTVYMPYCMRGGTAPMSAAGALIQCNAEVLGGLVLSQAVSPGTPFIYGAMPSIMDMKTTVGSYGAPEFHLLVAAASEIADYYGLPFYGTAGCSDAKFLDEQGAAEMAMEIMSTLLSKANLIHDVGIFDHCLSVAPEAVVLADEMIDQMRHYAAGINMDEADAALETIASVAPGGDYLQHPATAKSFREIWYPRLFSRRMMNPDKSEVRPKILETLLTVESQRAESGLSPETRRELADYFKKIDATP